MHSKYILVGVSHALSMGTDGEAAGTATHQEAGRPQCMLRESSPMLLMDLAFTHVACRTTHTQHALHVGIGGDVVQKPMPRKTGRRPCQRSQSYMGCIGVASHPDAEGSE